MLPISDLRSMTSYSRLTCKRTLREHDPGFRFQVDTVLAGFLVLALVGQGSRGPIRHDEKVQVRHFCVNAHRGCVDRVKQVALRQLGAHYLKFVGILEYMNNGGFDAVLSSELKSES